MQLIDPPSVAAPSASLVQPPLRLSLLSSTQPQIESLKTAVMASSRPPLSLLVPMGRSYSRDAAAAAGSPVLSHCTSPSATEEQQTTQLQPTDDSVNEQQPVDPSDWMPSPLPPLPPSALGSSDESAADEPAEGRISSPAAAAAAAAELDQAAANPSAPAQPRRPKRRIADLFAHLPDEDETQSAAAAEMAVAARPSKRGRGGRRPSIAGRPQLWQRSRQRATLTQQLLASPESASCSSSTSSSDSGSSSDGSSSESCDSDCSGCARQQISAAPARSSQVASAAESVTGDKLASRRVTSRSSTPAERSFVPCRPRASGSTSSGAATSASSAVSVPLSKRLTRQLRATADPLPPHKSRSTGSAASLSSISSMSSDDGGSGGRVRQPALRLSRITHTPARRNTESADSDAANSGIISVDESALAAEELKEPPDWMRDWLGHTIREAERMLWDGDRNEGEGEEADDADVDGSDDDATAAAAGSAPPPISAVCDQARAPVAALPSVAELLSFGFDFTVSRSQRLHGAQRHPFLAPAAGGQLQLASAAAAAVTPTRAAADVAAACGRCESSRPSTVEESFCPRRRQRRQRRRSMRSQTKESRWAVLFALDRAPRSGRAHHHSARCQRISVIRAQICYNQHARKFLSHQDSTVA